MKDVLTQQQQPVYIKDSDIRTVYTCSYNKLYA